MMNGPNSGTGFQKVPDSMTNQRQSARPEVAGLLPAVEFRDITVAYGPFVAVRNFSLSIAKGSFVTLLGPSGCGKTTVLRSIAGLVDVTAGQIMIGGRRVDDIPIYKRNIGLVFQSYALFPHKTVFDNVAFGLKYRNVPRPEIAVKVAQALEMVRLPGSEKKLPSQLSGGQQQRIALARAIVFEPEVLLLDEPLSALDANMREDMRVEIKKIQKATGITAIFVTHDQEEALSMSDQIVVMNAGATEQIGTPEQVYNGPCTAFVADFLGKANMLPGTVSGVEAAQAVVTLAGGQKIMIATDGHPATGRSVTVVVRPQKVMIGASAFTNRLTGRVLSNAYLGGSAIYEIDIGRGTTFRVNTPINGAMSREGETVEVSFDAASCILLDENGLKISA